jgi:hypothetical protein
LGILRVQYPQLAHAPAPVATDIAITIVNHGFHVTGIIAAHLTNCATLEKAAAIVNPASPRTTRLYDQRRDEISLDEVERVVI